MVWKSDLFWWFMRFVRVPPYEIWANRTKFYSSWENGDFFWCQTCCTLFHTQNEEKSQKIGTCNAPCIQIRAHVYANTWGGGGAPEIYGGVPLIGGPLKNYFLHLDFFCAQKKRVNLAMKKFKWGRVRKWVSSIYIFMNNVWECSSINALLTGKRRSPLWHCFPYAMYILLKMERGKEQEPPMA